jgi:hypothetical protein
MDGYTTWKLHRAISFHLTTQKYDIFEYKGRTKNSTQDIYERKNDKRFFEVIGNTFDRPNDAVQFFVANILYTGHADVHDIATGWENYTLWRKRKDALTKFLSDDIERLNLPNDILDGNPPRLLKELLSGRVMVETAVVLNRYIPFSKQWLEKSYFGAGGLPLIIDKADKFIGKFNEGKIKSFIFENSH